MADLTIDGRPVGDTHPPFVIAEIGSNHNGDMDLCRSIVDAAAACGADAVKLQSWSRGSLVSEAEYDRNTRYGSVDGNGLTLLEAVERYQLTPVQHHDVVAHCRVAGVRFLSSVFSSGEVDLLEGLDAPAYKIASMDVNHLALLERVSATRKPVLLSTGMAGLGEIERALNVLQRAGAGPAVLLHCVSLYPTPAEKANLRNIPMLRRVFGVPVGYSDHSLGPALALAAVALGACLVEKHFTIDRDLPGWDHAISANPDELRALVAGARRVYDALGSERRTVSSEELAQRRLFRRRAVTRRPLARGEQIAAADLDFKRPGTGIHPDETTYVVGRTVARDIAAEEELEWTDLV
jgi:N,N'-diacetyllegionaminate synthase